MPVIANRRSAPSEDESPFAQTFNKPSCLLHLPVCGLSLWGVHRDTLAPVSKGPTDFSHMPPNKSFRYLLTSVDAFTGWAEAFPTAREMADVAATILTEHIIPRFSLLEILQSDNGPAFISSITRQDSKSPNITWKLHIPYHPQSSGNLGWANGLLKEHLTKLTLESPPVLADPPPAGFKKAQSHP